MAAQPPAPWPVAHRHRPRLREDAHAQDDFHDPGGRHGGGDRGAAYRSLHDGNEPVTARAGEIFLPELQRRANDAREVVLTRNSGTATLKQQGDRWIFVEKGNYPANGEQVRRVLVELAELRPVESKTRKPDLYPRLQVEDPTAKDGRSTLMTVKDGQGGTIADVVIGRRRIDRLGGGRDSLYVRRKDSDRAGSPPAMSTSPASSSASWSGR